MKTCDELVIGSGHLHAPQSYTQIQHPTRIRPWRCEPLKPLLCSIWIPPWEVKGNGEMSKNAVYLLGWNSKGCMSLPCISLLWAPFYNITVAQTFLKTSRVNSNTVSRFKEDKTQRLGYIQILSLDSKKTKPNQPFTTRAST